MFKILDSILFDVWFFRTISGQFVHSFEIKWLAEDVVVSGNTNHLRSRCIPKYNPTWSFFSSRADLPLDTNEVFTIMRILVITQIPFRQIHYPWTHMTPNRDPSHGLTLAIFQLPKLDNQSFGFISNDAERCNLLRNSLFRFFKFLKSRNASLIPGKRVL